MQRRDFLATLGGVASLAVGCHVSASPASSRPNIVLLMSDDMGFSDLGCYGGEIRTPNLDGLAAAGLRFSQFYNTARCCPTRACLLTGLYPHQAGIGHMTGNQHLLGYKGTLGRDCVTIAEVLHDSGYATFMAGKWHVTGAVAPDGPKDCWPLQRGFDGFYGTITGAGSYYDPTTLCRGNRYITPENDPDYHPATFYYTDAITDNAISFVRTHNEQSPEKPFFLYVAYTAAHWPMHALPEDIAEYSHAYDGGYEPVRRARFERLRKLGLIEPGWELSSQAGKWSNDPKYDAWEARCMAVYAAMVHRMDRGIGRLVAELRRLGRLDNTVLFFLQDNGGCAEGLGRRDEARWHLKDLKPMGPDQLQPHIWPPMRTRDGRPVLGGPGVMPGPADSYISYGRNWANVSNTPFREYKHWVHEGGISTPLIVHWPAGLRRHGAIEQQPGHLVDIMATCVDAAGAHYPAERNGMAIQPMEGRSLVPTFSGGRIEREAIYWEHEGNRAVRSGRWKLVAKGWHGPWELYDMQTDRTEMHDLAVAQPERVKELAAKWQAWAERARVLPSPLDRQERKDVFSKQPHFELEQGDVLSREAAPNIGGRPFRLQAVVEHRGGDGVIVAQGGSALGYSLYVKRGVAAFAVRRQGALSVVTAPRPLAPGRRQLGATLGRHGAMTLLVDDSDVATGHAGGPIPSMPIDGLEVGRDEQGGVGEYEVPFAYGGRVEKVLIDLE